MEIYIPQGGEKGKGGIGARGEGIEEERF